MRDILIQLFNELLHESKANCEEYLNKLIDCETKVVFTKDPSYIISAHNWPESKKKPRPAPTQDQGYARQNAP